jgi:hypothetical protein
MQFSRVATFRVVLALMLTAVSMAAAIYASVNAEFDIKFTWVAPTGAMLAGFFAALALIPRRLKRHPTPPEIVTRTGQWETWRSARGVQHIPFDLAKTWSGDGVPIIETTTSVSEANAITAHLAISNPPVPVLHLDAREVAPPTEKDIRFAWEGYGARELRALPPYRRLTIITFSSNEPPSPDYIQNLASWQSRDLGEAHLILLELATGNNRSLSLVETEESSAHLLDASHLRPNEIVQRLILRWAKFWGFFVVLLVAASVAVDRFLPNSIAEAAELEVIAVLATSSALIVFSPFYYSLLYLFYLLEKDLSGSWPRHAPYFVWEMFAITAIGSCVVGFLLYSGTFGRSSLTATVLIVLAILLSLKGRPGPLVLTQMHREIVCFTTLGVAVAMPMAAGRYALMVTWAAVTVGVVLGRRWVLCLGVTTGVAFAAVDHFDDRSISESYTLDLLLRAIFEILNHSSWSAIPFVIAWGLMVTAGLLLPSRLACTLLALWGAVFFLSGQGYGQLGVRPIGGVTAAVVLLGWALYFAVWFRQGRATRRLACFTTWGLSLAAVNLLLEAEPGDGWLQVAEYLPALVGLGIATGVFIRSGQDFAGWFPGLISWIFVVGLSLFVLGPPDDQSWAVCLTGSVAIVTGIVTSWCIPLNWVESAPRAFVERLPLIAIATVSLGLALFSAGGGLVAYCMVLVLAAFLLLTRSIWSDLLVNSMRSPGVLVTASFATASFGLIEVLPLLVATGGFRNLHVVSGLGKPSRRSLRLATWVGSAGGLLSLAGGRGWVTITTGLIMFCAVAFVKVGPASASAGWKMMRSIALVRVVTYLPLSFGFFVAGIGGLLVAGEFENPGLSIGIGVSSFVQVMLFFVLAARVLCFPSLMVSSFAGAPARADLYSGMSAYLYEMNARGYRLHSPSLNDDFRVCGATGTTLHGRTGVDGS